MGTRAKVLVMVEVDLYGLEQGEELQVAHDVRNRIESAVDEELCEHPAFCAGGRVPTRDASPWGLSVSDPRVWRT